MTERSIEYWQADRFAGQWINYSSSGVYFNMLYPVLSSYSVVWVNSIIMKVSLNWGAWERWRLWPVFISKSRNVTIMRDKILNSYKVARFQYNLILEDFTAWFRKIPCEEKQVFHEIPLFNPITFNIIHIKPFQPISTCHALKFTLKFPYFNQQSAQIKIQ